MLKRLQFDMISVGGECLRSGRTISLFIIHDYNAKKWLIWPTRLEIMVRKTTRTRWNYLLSSSLVVKDKQKKQTVNMPLTTNPQYTIKRLLFMEHSLACYCISTHSNMFCYLNCFESIWLCAYSAPYEMLQLFHFN